MPPRRPQPTCRRCPPSCAAPMQAPTSPGPSSNPNPNPNPHPHPNPSQAPTSPSPSSTWCACSSVPPPKPRPPEPRPPEPTRPPPLKAPTPAEPTGPKQPTVLGLSRRRADRRAGPRVRWLSTEGHVRCCSCCCGAVTAAAAAAAAATHTRTCGCYATARRWSRLQPYVAWAAALCDRGCNPMCY